MKEGATHKIEQSEIPTSRRDKAKLEYRNHEKTKRTQIFLCVTLCCSVARNAKQTQFARFSAQKQGFLEKQTQIKPNRQAFCHSGQACPRAGGEAGIQFNETKPNGIS